MNLALIATAAGGLAVLSITVLWQMEKNTAIALEGKLQVLSVKFELQKSENLKLENALNEAHNISKKNIALIEKNSQRMTEYGDKLLLAEKENRQLAVYINDLRIAEMENAIKEPYQRGNAASDRWTHIMQRIAGATNTDSKDINHTDVTSSDLAVEPYTTDSH